MTLRVYTRESQAKAAARRFKDTYWSPRGGWRTMGWPDGEPEEQWTRLLDGPQTPERVAECLNESWTRPPTCDECGTEDVPTIELGQPPDYDSSTARVCRGCLVAALAKLTDEGGPRGL